MIYTVIFHVYIFFNWGVKSVNFIFMILLLAQPFRLTLPEGAIFWFGSVTSPRVDMSCVHMYIHVHFTLQKHAYTFQSTLFTKPQFSCVFVLICTLLPLCYEYI